MPNQEMPIFTRTFDFLTWLLPVTNHFPRAHRHTFTQRLLDAAFDLREHLEAAQHRSGRERLARLKQADEALDRVRVYVRLAAKRATARVAPTAGICPYRPPRGAGRLVPL